MTKIKLWISDIDGTLINYDGSCTNEMKNVIKKANDCGVKVVLATGRMYAGAKFAADFFNLNTPVVCYQGAIVRDENKILWKSPVKNAFVKEIVAYLRNKKIHTHIYNDDILYVEDDNKRIMDEYCNGRGTTYKTLNSFDELNLNIVPKVLAVIEENKLMREVKFELKQKYKGMLNIVQSAKNYLEITDIGASKGEALKFLKSYWNLKDDEILASGDQDNDIEMLKQAGIKACVGFNSEQIRKVAEFKLNSVSSNELVKLVERYL